MTTLVTGGSGYIGSHVVRLLEARGERVVIVDERQPHAPADTGAAFLRLDLAAAGAAAALREFVNAEGVESVVHFAARKRADESVARPVWYYRENIGGLATVLDAIEGGGVRRFVFSSSAAVYGSPPEDRVSEDSVASPINPYGRTKLAGEWLVEDAARALSFSAASLRYFNVAGAGWPDLGDRETLNLVTIVFDRLMRGLRPVVYGDDFDTADGSGVRDYVHVLDLARAHIDALDHLAGAPAGHRVFNVGTGTGTSVLQILRVIAEVSGLPVEPQVISRRAGDPAAVVASTERISDELGWRAEHDIRSIIASAWEAHLDRIGRV